MLEPPQALTPPLDIPADDGPLLLHEGDIQVTYKDATDTQQGVVRFQWHPRPGVYVQFSHIPFTRKFSLPLDSDITVAFGGIECTCDLVSQQFGTEHCEVLVICTKCSRPGPPEGCSSVQGLLGNSLYFHGAAIAHQAGAWHRGRLMLAAEHWQVTIDALPDLKKRIRFAIDNRTYAVSHVFDLETSLPELRTQESLRAILRDLGLFLSFAKGNWVTPFLPHTTSPSGEIAWHDFYVGRTSRQNPVPMWFDWQHPEWLERAFPGFLSLVQDERWATPIRRALVIYIDSNRLPSTIEESILMAQVALELLAWVYLVRDREFLLPEAYNGRGLSSADKIRLLLGAMGIPTTLANTSGILQRFAEDTPKVIDGPSLLTEVRNAIVHPTGKNWEKLERVDADLAYRACRLSLHYVVLVLLRLFGYDGEIVDHTSGAPQNRAVPWRDGARDTLLDHP